MTIAGNWIELEIILLREVTETQKDNAAWFLLFVDVSFESLDMCVFPLEYHGGQEISKELSGWHLRERT